MGKGYQKGPGLQLNKPKGIHASSYSTELPVHAARSEILRLFDKHPTLIIQGETGSGKTTQIPRFLLEHFQSKGVPASKNRVAVTQPRRVAAMSLAKRVADEMGVSLGKDVGYSVRFDDLSCPETRIKFLTDGMLLRELLSDPTLSRYSIIILDEAHERTLRTDILFGMLKRLQQSRASGKNPLKVVIMSATLNPEAFLEFFPGSVHYVVPGRQFPVRTFYVAEAQQDYLDAAVLTIFQLHMSKGQGDFLVFLTGQEEIEAVERLLSEHGPSCPKGTPRMLVAPLYASLPAHQQMAVFRPTPAGCRKIVLSTNIAETSITIPGIRTVIDPGFAKQRNFSAKTGIESLTVLPISRASARQRAGRAGREAPGECYRLYQEEAFNKLLEEETAPEILRTNLANVILTMKASGIDDVLAFDYLDAPETEAIARGLEELLALGALSPVDGRLTETGRVMAECPLIPQLSRALVEAAKLNCTEEAIAILSMLSGATESLFISAGVDRETSTAAKKAFMHRSGDHMTLLAIYEAYQANAKQRSETAWCRDHCLDQRSLKVVQSVREQLVQFCQRHSIPLVSCGGDHKVILKAFTAGHFLQAALRHPDGTYRTVIGRQVVYMHPSSVLHGTKPDCIMYHEVVFTSKCYLRSVSSIEPIWLTEYSKIKNRQ